MNLFGPVVIVASGMDVVIVCWTNFCVLVIDTDVFIDMSQVLSCYNLFSPFRLGPKVS